MLDQAQPTKAPSDLNAAEPIPAAVRDEIKRLLSSGDLFRYTSQNAPVTLLERELAAQLNRHPNVTVPEKLAPENRAPDSIQFNLTDMTDAAVTDFVRRADAQSIKVQVFGMSADNARAFWNWQFLNDIPELPKTRAMRMRACDVRLPARLTPQDCDMIGEILLNSLPSGELN